MASGDNAECRSRPLSPEMQEIDTCNFHTQSNVTEGVIPEATITYDSRANNECLNEVHNENNLKERIKQCRNIIESLKLELNQEKSRLEKDIKASHDGQEIKTNSDTTSYLDVPCSPDFYTTSVEDKLTCDENLIQYEKQLQRYQNTLNMAQIEKKNAIRKHMIAKAYKLKLLEVENQCNIELLRVKQSLQCLEPLQMIASKWKSNVDDFSYDLNNFELIPAMYPELNALSGSDVSSSVDDAEIKNKSPNSLNESVLSDL
ncbi:uncharacterized protein LOC123693190 [Colias croceus]|uniref:uncharacterized protein LOC123693190 n=1 Tax=Colias crocea TaxID=72248 RepID=UPI001E27DEE5|nr:uncharacterized protein LOC123693190 [Colias croceus]